MGPHPTSDLSGEYLLLENRQPLGFEAGMTQGGLAIWHIDERKSDNREEGYSGQSGWPANNRHYRVALVHADGRFDLERRINRGDADDLYRPGARSALRSDSVPSSDAYRNGRILPTGNQIVVTQASTAAISFTYTNTVWIEVALGEALDAIALPWTTIGDRAWIGQAITTSDGRDAAASGPISDGEESHLQTELAGPGQLSFRWKNTPFEHLDVCLLRDSEIREKIRYKPCRRPPDQLQTRPEDFVRTAYRRAFHADTLEPDMRCTSANGRSI